MLINDILKKLGVQIKRYPEGDRLRRIRMIKHFNIDTLFDVGANKGQYGSEIRSLGYNRKIISFEPLSSAFAKLQKESKNDSDWIVKNYALGDTECKTTINVSRNSYSSSLLKMTPAHVKSAPESEFVAKEKIETRKLDSVFESLTNPGNNIMLKIDTQGYEKKVLEGALNVLSYMKILQLEMSLVPLYDGEILFIDMIDFLAEKEFKLHSLEPGFSDRKTGQLLQVDGLFINESLNKME